MALDLISVLPARHARPRHSGVSRVPQRTVRAAWLCQQLKPPETWTLILANWSSGAAVQAHLEHTQEATQRLRTSSRLRTSRRVSSSRRFMLEAFEIALILKRALRERKRLSRDTSEVKGRVNAGHCLDRNVASDRSSSE